MITSQKELALVIDTLLELLGHVKCHVNAMLNVKCHVNAMLNVKCHVNAMLKT